MLLNEISKMLQIYFPILEDLPILLHLFSESWSNLIINLDVLTVHIYLVMIELANQIYDFPIKNDNPAETQQRKEIKKTIARAKSRTIIIKH